MGEYLRGRKTFEKYCAICHSAPEKAITDQIIFDKLFERLPKPPEDYFMRFILDSRMLKSSKDSYAMKLADFWGSKYEHQFKDSLSNQDLVNLITYIKLAIKR